MSTDKKKTNTFGGKNPFSLYIPLSETEQEVISRLVETRDLKVIVHGWTVIESPYVTYGDKNLHVHLKLSFDRPTTPVEVLFFDLELQSISGISLFRKNMETGYLKVMAGLELEMVWDISIRYIDPKVVKLLKPNATGLTSRLQDSLTGEMTLFGNMKLDKDQKQKAVKIRQGEKKLQEESAKALKGSGAT